MGENARPGATGEQADPGARGKAAELVAMGDEQGLGPFRRRLDAIDEQIATLLGERFQICREVAMHKRKHDIPMMQPGRVDVVRARYLARAEQVDLPADFTGSLFDLLIGATCRMEDELIDGPTAAGSG